MLAVTQARVGRAHKRQDNAFENGTVRHAVEKSGCKWIGVRR
jgi:hypothetical protein